MRLGEGLALGGDRLSVYFFFHSVPSWSLNPPGILNISIEYGTFTTILSSALISQLKSGVETAPDFKMALWSGGAPTGFDLSN